VLTTGEALDTTALSSLRGHLVCPLHSLNINSPYFFFSHKPYTSPLAAHKIVYELAQNKSPIQRFFTNQRFAQSITSLPNPVSYSSPSFPRYPQVSQTTKTSQENAIRAVPHPTAEGLSITNSESSSSPLGQEPMHPAKAPLVQTVTLLSCPSLMES